MMLNSLMLMFVKFIHLCLVLFIVGVPFVGNEWLLTMHAIIVPGIIMHWMTNNNICSLTYLESKLSGVSVNDTFIGKILFPFFEVNNKFIYLIVLLLLFLTLLKLNKTGFGLLKLCISIILDFFVVIWEKIRNVFSSPSSAI